MILPDVIGRGMKVIFCGTSVGKVSGEGGTYYADKTNCFWDIIHKIGLTPRKLKPTEYRVCIKYGIGFTDIVKHRSGNDSGFNPDESDIENFREKIIKYQPKILAFNGKKAAMVFLDKRKSSEIEYGFQDLNIINSRITVLPSTSGNAKKYWNIKYWYEMADAI